MHRYLLFASRPGYVSILRPLQRAIAARGDHSAWFLTRDVDPCLLGDEDERLDDIAAVRRFAPRAVFVPGNWVPDFFPGVKVQIFHDVGFTKKNRFRIRGLFDLYCTCGPRVTRVFAQIAARDPHFAVIETGWPKLDPLFRNRPASEPSHQRLRVLYAPTFSPSLTSAHDLFPEIEALSRNAAFDWTVKFHDRMDAATADRYRALQGPNLRVSEDPDIVPLLQWAELMVSDTSSVIVEFLLLNKPVITYRNREPGEHLLDITHASALGDALQRIKEAPAAAREAASRYAAANHPYHDGRSSERVLDALEHFMATLQPGLRSKPLNLWRKLRIRRQLRYFRFR